MSPKQKIVLFITVLIATLFLVRGFLSISPFSNLNFGPYNIHHLFPGAFLLVIAVIFLIIGMSNKSVIVIAGVGSALVLDEIVYLIATDGGDLAYLTPISFWGAVILTIVALLIAGVAYRKL